MLCLSSRHLGQSLPPSYSTCPQPADGRRSTYWSAGRTAQGSLQGQGRITYVADSAPGVSENPSFLHAQCPWRAPTMLPYTFESEPSQLGRGYSWAASCPRCLSCWAVTSLGISRGPRSQLKPGHHMEPQTWLPPAEGKRMPTSHRVTPWHTIPTPHRVLRGSPSFSPQGLSTPRILVAVLGTWPEGPILGTHATD